MSGIVGRAIGLLVVLGWLQACSEQPADIRASNTGIRFLGDSQTAGFERAVEPHVFSFPRDHGDHDGFRSEWWYFTGNLHAADGRHFGFELTFFRYALAPGTMTTRQSAWASRQVWMAHFAVTDTANNGFHVAERTSRGALGLAGAQPERLAVWLEDWSAAQAENGDPIRLRARQADVEIDLLLEPQKAIVLQGDAGLDSKGPEPGNASYYYSWPRLQTSGTIRLAGESVVAVDGLSWLDREWGTSSLSPGIVGWDWLTLQLADGRDVMLYRLRDSQGRASRWSSGMLIDADGTLKRLASTDIVLVPVDVWHSPKTGVRYPIAWRLQIPSAALELEIEAAVPNQEIDLGVRYWEGAVLVRSVDSERPVVVGEGYLELVGYTSQ